MKFKVELLPSDGVSGLHGDVTREPDGTWSVVLWSPQSKLQKPITSAEGLTAERLLVFLEDHRDW